jgi:hypothetical protein
MEEAFNRQTQGQSALPVLVVGGMYEVDVVSMLQRNRATGFTRPVLRLPTNLDSSLPNCASVPVLNLRPDNPLTSAGSGKPSDMAWGSATGCRVIRAGIVRYELRGDPGHGDTREVREYNMAFGQCLRLHSGPGSGFLNITGVDVYENAPLAARFARERGRLLRAGAPVGETWVFHGTGTADNVVSIMCDGFKVGGSTDGIPIVNGAVHGKGVYTAKGPNTPMSYGRRTGQVILARALQGRRGAVAPPLGGGGLAGPDSWEPTGDWVVFRGGEQLLPVYVVHYNSDVHTSPAPQPASQAGQAGSSAQAGPKKCAVM